MAESAKVRAMREWAMQQAIDEAMDRHGPVIHAWSDAVEKTNCGLSIYGDVRITRHIVAVDCPDCLETLRG